MVHIHFDLDKELNKQIRKYMAEENISNKSKAILKILHEKFAISIREGFKNLLK